ncbi:MAG: DUF742 domain-containing protein [Sciscionella sp.]|nr:DUF742 domain-containing protein [Sciscionella sp.]
MAQLREFQFPDEPNRFDISEFHVLDGNRPGLFGGPGAELLGGESADQHSPTSSSSATDPARYGAHALSPEFDELGQPSTGAHRADPTDRVDPSDVAYGGHSLPAHTLPEHALAAHPLEIPPARSEDAGNGHPPATSRPVASGAGQHRRPTATLREGSDYDLALEALVSTSELGQIFHDPVRPEHRSIAGLCMHTRSVAEVAAYLRIPLNMARGLIGDMVSMGLVMVNPSGVVFGDRPSRDFLERVLSGLHSL